MSALRDLAGLRFGKLLVLELSHSDQRAFWKCLCDCGTTKVVQSRLLVTGKVRSCGCMSSRLTVGDRTRTHGEGGPYTRSAEYRTWAHMVERCTNTGSKDYPEYGGRGILVCDRWLRFENFLEDMGRRPSLKHSLDRFPNNNGHYDPGNCRWASPEQQANNRRSNRLLTYLGKSYTLMELVKHCFPDEPSDRARCRLKARIDLQGLSVEEAVSRHSR